MTSASGEPRIGGDRARQVKREVTSGRRTVGRKLSNWAYRLVEELPEGWLVIDMDATLITAHSPKEGATPP